MGRVVISRGAFEAYPEIRRLVEEHSRLLTRATGGESSASEIQVMSGDEILRFFRGLSGATDDTAPGRTMVIIRLSPGTHAEAGEFIQALNEILSSRRMGAVLVLVGAHAHSAEFMQYPVMTPQEAVRAIDRFLRDAEEPASGLVGTAPKTAPKKNMRIGIGGAPVPEKKPIPEGEEQKRAGVEGQEGEKRSGPRLPRHGLPKPSFRLPAPKIQVPKPGLSIPRVGKKDTSSSPGDGADQVSAQTREHQEEQGVFDHDFPVGLSGPVESSPARVFPTVEIFPVLEILFWVLAIGGLIAAAVALAGYLVRLPWF